MQFLGTTPFTEYFTGYQPSWLTWYYQFKKEGYYDSQIITAQQLPVNTDRRVWAILKRIESSSNNNVPRTPNKKYEAKARSGTGFIVNKKGNIITNYHVVMGCRSIEVKNPFFSSKAEVIFTDKTNDLALLAVDTQPPQNSFGYFRSESGLRSGDDIIAIGYPLGQILGESAKVTIGNISSMTGIADDSNILQITAPVQPGNSGGPLLDKSGNIVGVVSAKLNEIATLKASGSIPQNVNFAIKSQTLQLFLDTHNITYFANNSEKTIVTADIVEKAIRYTVQIGCFE
ncbi:S1C family serine protease [Desulfoplanes sp. PS50]|jgi:S1-C subfamily serine protease